MNVSQLRKVLRTDTFNSMADVLGKPLNNLLCGNLPFPVINNVKDKLKSRLWDNMDLWVICSHIMESYDFK